MWVFGFRSQSRCLTQYKPRQVTPTDHGCTALVKLGTVFPVWVKLERISNDNEKEKI